MSVAEALEQLGGLASRCSLLEVCPRSAVDAALRDGSVIRVGHGRYALPAVSDAERLAHASNGVLCLTSAALHHGWEVKFVPESPHVLYPRHRKVPPQFRSSVVLHRGDLHTDDVSGIATAPLKTLEMCLRSLPPDEALAVADSALRHGFSATTLRAMARDARGPGAARIRRTAGLARAEAANPFESVLRSIAGTVAGLRVQPQLGIRHRWGYARPDLVDDDLRIVLEADSFEWHGGRSALQRDARRYDALTVEGWLVLRFSWEDVMFDPDHVREVLVAAVELATRRTEGCPGCGHAA